MKKNQAIILFFSWIFLIVFSNTVFSESVPKKENQSIWDRSINPPSSPVQFSLNMETGFLGFFSHIVQFGKKGENNESARIFDYVKEGGQDVLFPYLRFSAQMKILKKHSIVFLYQPFDVRTETVLGTSLVQDMATFRAGEVLDIRYGFDFYRLSYLYDFLSHTPHELSLGLSFQIRNATIQFSSKDGSKSSFRRDVGFVPIIKLRSRFNLPKGFWMEVDADGFYAPIKYFNGGSSDVVGAILDASVRMGKRITPFLEIYGNLRYIGGGAEGTSSSINEPKSDGFQLNWLHSFSVSLGITIM